MERVPFHDREMEISIQYHVMLIRQSNDQILMRCYIKCNRQLKQCHVSDNINLRENPYCPSSSISYIFICWFLAMYTTVFTCETFKPKYLINKAQ